VKLFLNNSNACDHNPPTLQRDRQTDGQTDNLSWHTARSFNALRYASRGKNGNFGRQHSFDASYPANPTNIRIILISSIPGGGK